MQESAITTRELVARLGVDAARISDAARALGIGPGRGRPLALAPAEAALLIAARRLMELGLSQERALACAGQVPLAELRRFIETDEPRWLVVLPDRSGQAEFVCRVADAEEMLTLAEAGGGGFRGLRVVDLRAALAEAFAAAREAGRRVAAESAGAGAVPSRAVTKYQGDRLLTGVFLRADLRLDLVRSGRGLSIQLAPDEARELADALERTAEAVEAQPPRGLDA